MRACTPKVFSVDRKRVFIGSFNFDARSVRLNTEMGLVIDSPGLAQSVAEAVVNGRYPLEAYTVRLRDDAIEWVDGEGAEQVVHTREPNAGFWRRATVSVLSRLPIDWLL